MNKLIMLLTFGLFLATTGTAHALDTYTEAQQAEFTSWCTGAKSNSEPMCNCALKQVMQTVAPAALATFLASDGQITLSQTSVMTATAVTQALTSCSK